MFKALVCIFGLLGLALPSLATVDGHTHVYLVVEHIQSGEYFIEKAPMIGCYGIAKGPQLVQFTSEYKVPSNIGCGGTAFLDNINALTCAEVTDSEEADDFDGFKSVTLNISKCAAKENPDFLSMAKKAAKMNFASKKGPFSLKLLK